MDGTTIAKHPENWPLTPNLLDHEATSAAFTWKRPAGRCWRAG
jgi:hypothetical protein